MFVVHRSVRAMEDGTLQELPSERSGRPHCPCARPCATVDAHISSAEVRQSYQIFFIALGLKMIVTIKLNFEQNFETNPDVPTR